MPRGTRGLRIGKEAMTLGLRAMVQNTVYLDDARVSRTQCLGAVGGAVDITIGLQLFIVVL